MLYLLKSGNYLKIGYAKNIHQLKSSFRNLRKQENRLKETVLLCINLNKRKMPALTQSRH